jgi:hypothetical protein
MYLSRRHYRRLLLPPGWVALGSLLLLGCQVLLTHRRQLLPKAVLQLAMPVLEKVAAKQQRKGNSTGYLFSNPLASIKTATHWQDAALIGRPAKDSVSEAAIEAMVTAMQADNGHARGVRVRLSTGATYSNLVSLLAMMNRLNQPKYWFAIEHQPLTFYAVNDKAVKSRRLPTSQLIYY